MKVSFLVHNVFGVGGTNRAVLNLAGELGKRHTVEIASVFRWQNAMSLDLPRNVKVVSLVDGRVGRPDRTDRRRKARSGILPVDEEYFQLYSELTDIRIMKYLAETDADVVVGTRPGLNLMVARFGQAHVVKVAQEHMTHDMVASGIRSQMRDFYPNLDASVTLTTADAEEFGEVTPVPGLRIEVIPNSVPRSGYAVSTGASKLVIAAGRLVDVKRYDLLMRAFAKVVVERPDWKLRIYGSGVLRNALLVLIADLSLFNHVTLMGAHADLDAEWPKGSIAVVTSDRESFGMTVVEAMRSGLPVVSTACSAGPPEIITDGVDGLLVPLRNVDAIAEALLALVNDDQLRQQMGDAAHLNSERFDPQRIGADYERLFAHLLGAKRAGRSSSQRSLAPAPSGRPRAQVRQRGKAMARNLAGRSLRSAARAMRLRQALRWAARFVHRRPRLRERIRQTVQQLGLKDNVAAIRARMRVIAVTNVGQPRRVSALPVGDCWAQPDGSVQVALTSRHGSKVDLVCLPRGDREHRGLHIPFTVDESGRTVAVIPAKVGMLEAGRTDLFVAVETGTLSRLRVGLLDTRSLVDGAWGSDALVNNLPYRTRDGYLAVRSWCQGAFAEVENVFYEDDIICLSVRMLGVPESVRLVSLRLRHRLIPDLVIWVGSEPVSGGSVSFNVPMRTLVAKRRRRREDWEIAVATVDSDLDLLIPVGRVWDDIPASHTIHIYPGVRVIEDLSPELIDETPQRPIWIKPRLSDDGLMLLSITEE